MKKKQSKETVQVFYFEKKTENTLVCLFFNKKVYFLVHHCLICKFLLNFFVLMRLDTVFIDPIVQYLYTFLLVKNLIHY